MVVVVLLVLLLATTNITTTPSRVLSRGVLTIVDTFQNDSFDSFVIGSSLFEFDSFDSMKVSQLFRQNCRIYS